MNRWYQRERVVGQKDLIGLFVFVSARTQHRLTACGQHHFSQRENIVIYMRTQNEVMVNAINDIALRQNMLCFAQMMLHLAV